MEKRHDCRDFEDYRDQIAVGIQSLGLRAASREANSGRVLNEPRMNITAMI